MLRLSELKRPLNSDRNKIALCYSDEEIGFYESYHTHLTVSKKLKELSFAKEAQFSLFTIRRVKPSPLQAMGYKRPENVERGCERRPTPMERARLQRSRVACDACGLAATGKLNQFQVM